MSNSEPSATWFIPFRLLQKLGESDWTQFLTGTTVTDYVFFDLEVGLPSQPLRVAGLITGRRDPAGWWGPGRPADHTDAIDSALFVSFPLRLLTSKANGA